jgi:hypothetical protein
MVAVASRDSSTSGVTLAATIPISTQASPPIITTTIINHQLRLFQQFGTMCMISRTAISHQLIIVIGIAINFIMESYHRRNHHVINYWEKIVVGTQSTSEYDRKQLCKMVALADELFERLLLTKMRGSSLWNR